MKEEIVDLIYDKDKLCDYIDKDTNDIKQWNLPRNEMVKAIENLGTNVDIPIYNNYAYINDKLGEEHIKIGRITSIDLESNTACCVLEEDIYDLKNKAVFFCYDCDIKDVEGKPYSREIYNIKFKYATIQDKRITGYNKER